MVVHTELKERFLFYPPELGCVLYMPGLPGGSNKLYDRSPYGNIGTITGAVWTKLPSGLWVLSFDGVDDYVDCGLGASLQLRTAITLGVWVKPDSTKNTNYGRYAAYWESYLLGQEALDQTRVRWEFTGFVPTVLNSATGVITVDAWNKVVGTWDGAVRKIYVNGFEVATENITGTLATSTRHFVVGSIGDNPYTQFFGGIAGLVCLYNRALSALEIRNLFDQEKHLFGVW